MIVERYLHAPGEHHFPPLPENTASLYLGRTVNSVRWSDGAIHEGPTSEGDVTLKAAGQPIGWRFDGEAGLLVMRLAPAFLVRVAEENGLDAGAVELRPSVDRRDSVGGDVADERGMAEAFDAVDAISLVLAKELRGRDITVNAVAPGPTATARFLDGKNQETIDGKASMNPLERLGTPEDIAEVVSLLAGPGRWVNGQTLYANGGMA